MDLLNNIYQSRLGKRVMTTIGNILKQFMIENQGIFFHRKNKTNRKGPGRKLPGRIVFFFFTMQTQFLFFTENKEVLAEQRIYQVAHFNESCRDVFKREGNDESHNVNAVYQRRICLP